MWWPSTTEDYNLLARQHEQQRQQEQQRYQEQQRHKQKQQSRRMQRDSEQFQGMSASSFPVPSQNFIPQDNSRYESKSSRTKSHGHKQKDPIKKENIDVEEENYPSGRISPKVTFIGRKPLYMSYSWRGEPLTEPESSFQNFDGPEVKFEILRHQNSDLPMSELPPTFQNPYTSTSIKTEHEYSGEESRGRRGRRRSENYREAGYFIDTQPEEEGLIRIRNPSEFMESESFQEEEQPAYAQDSRESDFGSSSYSSNSWNYSCMESRRSPEVERVFRNPETFEFDPNAPRSGRTFGEDYDNAMYVQEPKSKSENEYETVTISDSESEEDMKFIPKRERLESDQEDSNESSNYYHREYEQSSYESRDIKFNPNQYQDEEQEYDPERPGIAPEFRRRFVSGNTGYGYRGNAHSQEPIVEQVSRGSIHTHPTTSRRNSRNP